MGKISEFYIPGKITKAEAAKLAKEACQKKKKAKEVAKRKKEERQILYYNINTIKGRALQLFDDPPADFAQAYKETVKTEVKKKELMKDLINRAKELHKNEHSKFQELVSKANAPFITSA